MGRGSKVTQRGQLRREWQWRRCPEEEEVEEQGGGEGGREALQRREA